MAPPAPPLGVERTLDSGQRFRRGGQGLDARPRGKPAVRSRPHATSVALGSIEAASGTYRAFAKIDIERRRLVFDGGIEPGSTR